LKRGPREGGRPSHALSIESSPNERLRPEVITIDNGTEFTSRHFDNWAYTRGIQLDFIRPGKPVENGYVESFNGKYRDECLSQSWFLGLEDARATTLACCLWRGLSTDGPRCVQMPQARPMRRFRNEWSLGRPCFSRATARMVYRRRHQD
jgi:hypothetical protein